jgi:hypothetical protein
MAQLFGVCWLSTFVLTTKIDLIDEFMDMKRKIKAIVELALVTSSSIPNPEPFTIQTFI